MADIQWGIIEKIHGGFAGVVQKKIGGFVI